MRVALNCSNDTTAPAAQLSRQRNKRAEIRRMEPKESWRSGTRLLAVRRFTRSPPAVAQVDGRLFRIFVDVWGQRALLQRVAQLGAEKAAGRVAGDAGIETINQIAHHGRIFIDYLGEYLEVVVVDDGADLSNPGRGRGRTFR